MFVVLAVLFTPLLSPSIGGLAGQNGGLEGGSSSRWAIAVTAVALATVAKQKLNFAAESEAAQLLPHWAMNQFQSPGAPPRPAEEVIHTPGAALGAPATTRARSHSPAM